MNKIRDKFKVILKRESKKNTHNKNRYMKKIILNKFPP